MMAAKVGTGIVAELGSMRISDEIDALEVMGIDSMRFLCATKLLAAWMVLPFVYIAAVGAGFFASYLAVVQQIGEVSSGGFFLVFWMFQNPPDLLYSVIKGMFMATVIVLVGCYYGYNASGGPVGVGTGDGEVDGAQHRARAPDRHAVDPGVLGGQSKSTDRRLKQPMDEDRRDDETRESPQPEAARQDDPLEAQGAGQASDDRRRGSWLEEAEQPTRVSEPPQAEQKDEEYRWHTGIKRDAGVPDAIEFIDVHKAFGRNRILMGLNMGIPEGMISMILGPSGTGKSVCIKHMVGLLYPDDGDVLVHGESVPNMADDELFEMRKKFGVLFQDGALFGSMNLYDNTAFPLRQHTDKSEDEIAEIVNRRLREVGLAEAGDKMPNELSGGMRKRAGFARALVLDPGIVPVRRARLGPRPRPHGAPVRAHPGGA
jgi:ABC-type ATPase involved in cell division